MLNDNFKYRLTDGLLGIFWFFFYLFSYYFLLLFYAFSYYFLLLFYAFSYYFLLLFYLFSYYFLLLFYFFLSTFSDRILTIFLHWIVWSYRENIINFLHKSLRLKYILAWCSYNEIFFSNFSLIFFMFRWKRRHSLIRI